jgi:serine protease Do
VSVILATLLLGQVVDQSAAYRAAVDSVVYVVGLNNQWERATGTGVVVDAEQGLVVSANHVVEGRLVWVFFPERDATGEVINRPDYYTDANKGSRPCAVVRVDPKRDLALLRILNKPPVLKALKLAAKPSAPGEAVFAIGNAGPLLWGFTGGNVRRSFQGDYLSGTHQISARIVETSCGINPGDSGGPLINQSGEIAGIVSSFDPGVNQVQKSIDASEVTSFLAADGKKLAGDGKGLLRMFGK